MPVLQTVSHCTISIPICNAVQTSSSAARKGSAEQAAEEAELNMAAVMTDYEEARHKRMLANQQVSVSVAGTNSAHPLLLVVGKPCWNQQLPHYSGLRCHL